MFLAAVLTTAVCLRGQNFTIRNYTTREGLPHNNVRCIARDSTGFLWLATWDGLSRFDGHEFRNYYHKANDPSSLPFFSVYKIAVDRYNNLWVLCDDMQLVRYERSQDNFRDFNSLSTINTGALRGICTDNKGNLIVWNESEVFVQNGNDDFKVMRLLSEEDKDYYIAGGRVNSVSLFNDELWLGDQELIMLFRSTDDTTYLFEKQFIVNKRHTGRNIDFDIREWQKIYCSPAGKRWLFSNTGLYLLDNDRSEFNEFTSDIPSGEFVGAKFFSWGWKNGGIYFYNTLSRQTHIIPGQYAKYPIHFIADDESSVWFSNTTSSGVALGLSHLVFTPDFFQNIMFTDSDSVQPAVYAVALDKHKKLWTGLRGYDHLLVIDSSGKSSSEGKLDTELFNISFHVRSLLAEPDGIWIGYFRKLLRYFSFSTGKYTSYFPETYGARTILKTRDDKLYIGSDGLFIFDYYEQSTSNVSDLPSKMNTSIFRLFSDGDSVIYCTMSGSKILAYRTADSTVSLIEIPGGVVNAEDIIRGNNNEFWIAMLGEGVCRYRPEAGEFSFFTTYDGLANNTTYSLLKDKSGNIWVTTNNGISRINPATGRIRSFGRNEGLEISEFNSGAKFESDDGEFIFGGMGGVVRFYPDSLTEERTGSRPGKIILTQLRVSGAAKYLDEDLNEAKTIVLRKGENNFRLTFAISDFRFSDKTLYRYRIKELKEDWIETDHKDRSINYANLNPGLYNLSIQATDINGNWSIEKSVQVRLNPHYYQTIWFKLLIAAVTLFLITGFFAFYIRNIRQKEALKQDELKLQSLRGQMNPHFIFNSLNSINYFISNNDRLSANRYIADFSRLIRSILANLGSNFVPFDNEIESIEDYLKIEHLRFGDKFDYELKIDPAIKRHSYEICPGLIQPFIENSIWHGVRALEGRKGMIIVGLHQLDEKKLKCTITDDGIGMRAASEKQHNSLNHKSKGIELVKERLLITGKLLHAEYNIEIRDLWPEREYTGTEVQVEIPYKTISK